MFLWLIKVCIFLLRKRIYAILELLTVWLSDDFFINNIKGYFSDYNYKLKISRQKLWNRKCFKIQCFEHWYNAQLENPMSSLTDRPRSNHKQTKIFLKSTFGLSS